MDLIFFQAVNSNWMEPSLPVPTAAYICHMRSTSKYSYKKMWYVAAMVRGLSVEEAIKQLTFVDKAGAVIAK